ncbi:hypothetical protein ACLOJK_036270 [Asimina triloba]
MPKTLNPAAMSPASSSFLLFLKRSRNSSNLLPSSSSLSFLRHMGGGPRTFPGGLNKWQWKRLHEKKAREKEKKLLHQEKQLYQARIRSEIRAKLAGWTPDPPSDGSDSFSKEFAAMTPKDHIKALADRFMKEGAEDLWNDDDGPLKPPASSIPRPPIRSPSSLDLRKTILGRQEIDPSGRRNYSVESKRRPGSRFRFRGGGNSSDDSDDEDDFGSEGGGRISRKNMMSSAALREYDAKVVRRAPKVFEPGYGASEEVRLIREEFNLRKAVENEQSVNDDKEESLLSEKRKLIINFD